MHAPRYVLLVNLALALTVGGCGDDGDSTVAAPSPAASVAASASGNEGGGEDTSLIAVIGTAADPDAFTLSLTDGSGDPVTTLPAGDYSVKVADHSKIHNFHLRGPGVEETTGVPGTGDESWTVTLAAGSYTVVCDPHPKKMHAEFTVT